MFGKPRTAVLLLLVVAALGCGGTRSRSQQELDEAQDAVKTALSAWKNKQSRKALESAASIQVSDPDWSAGYQLLDFEIQKTERLEGKNPRSTVSLSLKDRRDRKVERAAVYEITTTGGKKVVARELFY